mmetsp:Transcript_18536/g.51667  ORF Transcript_18536/g.51667 Transcript_18536/m.51667 type:complete len:226 (-) Transcript_18536:2466-3143(-)
MDLAPGVGAGGRGEKPLRPSECSRRRTQYWAQLPAGGFLQVVLVRAFPVLEWRSHRQRGPECEAPAGRQESEPVVRRPTARARQAPHRRGQGQAPAGRALQAGDSGGSRDWLGQIHAGTAVPAGRCRVQRRRRGLPHRLHAAPSPGGSLFGRACALGAGGRLFRGARGPLGREAAAALGFHLLLHRRRPPAAPGPAPGHAHRRGRGAHPGRAHGPAARAPAAARQ